MGYLWSLVKPLAMFAVLYIVFSKIVKAGDNFENYPAYLLLGVIVWNYSAESTVAGMRSVVDRGHLIKKIYFPKLILPISSTTTSLMTLGLNLVVFGIFAAISGVSVSAASLLVIPLMLELYLFTLGVSMLLASYFVKFRDFGHIWEVALQLLFYGTPIVYLLQDVGNATAQKIILLNPFAQIIQDARYLLINQSQTITAGQVFSGWRVVAPYVIALATFAVGYYAYIKRAGKFAEQV